MHILRGIEVSIGLVVTDGTPEQLSPFRFDAFAAMGREPLALRTAPRAILRCPVWIDFDRDHSLGEGFGFRVFIDLAT